MDKSLEKGKDKSSPVISPAGRTQQPIGLYSRYIQMKEDNSPLIQRRVNNDKSEYIHPQMDVVDSEDATEKEADATADQVMASPESDKEEGMVQTKPLAGSISRKSKSTGGMQISGDTASYVGNLSGGQALSRKEREFYEPRFGADFSNVKVHNDSKAHQAAQSINAKAFTSGNNIVFGKGQYSPDSSSGKHLMAHELTHTVQQGNSDFLRREQDNAISVGDVRDEIIQINSQWHDGASQGIVRFGTNEIERRLNRMEKASIGDFLLGFLGNSIWAAAAFTPVGLPAFLVSMTGIAVASIPQVVDLLNGEKSVTPITAVQGSMYEYINSYEGFLNDYAEIVASRILSENPNLNKNSARIEYLKQLFGESNDNGFYETEALPDINKSAVGDAMFQYATEQFGYLTDILNFTNDYESGMMPTISGDEEEGRRIRYQGNVIVEGELDILTHLYGNRIMVDLRYPDFYLKKRPNVQLGSYGRNDLPTTVAMYSQYINIISSFIIQTQLHNSTRNEGYSVGLFQNNIDKLRSTLDNTVSEQTRQREEVYNEYNGDSLSDRMLNFVYTNEWVDFGKPYRPNEYLDAIEPIVADIQAQLNALEQATKVTIPSNERPQDSSHGRTV